MRYQAVEAIIFDLDGTLYHLGWTVKSAILVNLLPRPHWLFRFFEARAKLNGKEFDSREDLYEALCRECAPRFGITPPRVHAWIEHRFYPSFIRALHFALPFRAGLTDALRDLRAAGIKLGVLSDFDRIEERLLAIGLSYHLFDCCVSAEALGSLKPSPLAFEHTAHRLTVQPERILVIGDRDDTDGAGAIRTGMQFQKIGKPADQSARTWPGVLKQLREIVAYRENDNTLSNPDRTG